MLVKHAQEQLDRGALLEAEGQGPSLVSGVKISTYFALLIRPFRTGNPLLRELYALGQSIDLLRARSARRGGRLPGSPLHSCSYGVERGQLADGLATRVVPSGADPEHNNSHHAASSETQKAVVEEQGLVPYRAWGGRRKRKGPGVPGEREERRWWQGARPRKGKGGKEAPWSNKGEANPWKDNKEEPPKK